MPVEEIAQRAGVGMGTLYRRFPTKHDLVQAVIEESLGAFVAAAEEALAERDPWTGFTRFVERVLELQTENRALREVLAGTETARRATRCAGASARSCASSCGAPRPTARCAPTSRPRTCRSSS